VASSEVRFTLRSRVRSDVLKRHQVRATLAEGGRSSIPGIARHKYGENNYIEAPPAVDYRFHTLQGLRAFRVRLCPVEEALVNEASVAVLDSEVL
jgi:hypothetical protein